MGLWDGGERGVRGGLGGGRDELGERDVGDFCL